MSKTPADSQMMLKYQSNLCPVAIKLYKLHSNEYHGFHHLDLLLIWSVKLQLHTDLGLHSIALGVKWPYRRNKGD